MREYIRYLKKYLHLPNNFWKRMVDMCVGMVIGLCIAADILFARGINMKEAGVTLWIFIAVGTIIILLQLIPAFILFTSFIAGLHTSIKTQQEVEERELQEEEGR